jgi:outer membrane protein assembly factor BamA
VALAGAAGGAYAQQPPEPPRLPTFAQLEAAGARIGEIRIVPEDIFDLSDPRENNFFFRLANKLHINTRPEVIRRLLLFQPGEKVSVQAIEETERQLRNKAYFYDASIRPLAYADGVVDLEVRTRDTWSFDLGIGVSRAGGENTGRLSVKEDNILGTGISVGVGYTSDVDRKGVQFEVSDSNLFGTRGTIAAAHAENDDGRNSTFSLARPFYALDARWAAGFGVSSNDGLNAIYNAGNVEAEYRHRRTSGDAFGGWSPGLIRGWTQRYSLGVFHQDDTYELEPGKPVPERLPDDLNLSGPFLRFELIEDAYRKDTNVNLIGRIEDFSFGVQTMLQLGHALESLGSTRDAWLYSASVSDGVDITNTSFLLLNAGTSGRDRGENQALSGAARYYHRVGRRLLYYTALSAEAVHNPDAPGPLTIGGDSGLRGYPLRYQTGERRVLFTAEARAYTDWYPFRLFRVGGAVFYDTGRAWHGENVNTTNSGWLRDVGFGLRLLSARTSKGNVLHADFAFPLDPDPSIKRVQFLVKTKVAF